MIGMGEREKMSEARAIDWNERRRVPDRRKRPTPMFSKYTVFGGRRIRARRENEKRGSFVDQHGVGLLVLLLLVAGFNIVDAYFTLFFLGHGAREANPVALFLLNIAPWVFVLSKSLGIGICLAFLCLAKNFYTARFGLFLVFTLYFLLSLYHLFLLGTQMRAL